LYWSAFKFSPLNPNVVQNKQTTRVSGQEIATLRLSLTNNKAKQKQAIREKYLTGGIVR